MRRVFADTHFFVALLRERDAGHWNAADWWARLKDVEIVTSAWILVELANTMSERPHERRLCVQFIEDAMTDEAVCIIEDSNLFWRGYDLYRQREDKEWSLTDCISFVAMSDQELTDALTGDHHFEQAGFTALLASR